MTAIATCRSYTDLIEALRARMAKFGITTAKLDELAVMPDGYTGKVFGPARVRAMGPLAFDNYLGTLGVDFVLVENQDRTARLINMIEKGTPMLTTGEHASRRPRTLKESLRRFYVSNNRRAAKLAVAGRMKKISPAKRRQIARKAALARWSKRREIGKAIEHKLEKKVP